MRKTFFLVVLLPLAAQVPPIALNSHTNDEALYQAFFHKVVDLKLLSSNPHMLDRNGRSHSIIVPKLQDVVGLTDGEVELITEMATDCVAKLKSVMERRPSVLEGRLERIESGQLSPALAKEFEERELDHRRVIMEHVGRINDRLGAKRFRLLDDFVHSATWERLLSPTLGENIAAPVQR